MSQPRQHHEVPCFYLRRFASRHNGKVAAFDLDRSRAYEQVPEELSTYRDSYAFETEDGTKNDGVDEILQRTENTAAPLVEELCKGTALDHQQRCDFSTFVGAMLVRSPFMRRNYGQMIGEMMQTVVYAHANFDGSWKEQAEFLRQQGRTDEEIGKAREAARDPSRFRMSIRRDATLASISLLVPTAEAVFDMSWTLIKASGCTFITSDSPVVMGSTAQRSSVHHGGPRMPHTILTFPLSPKVLWMGHWGRELKFSVRASPADVRDLNRKRVAACEHKLFAQPMTHDLAALARLRPKPRHSFRLARFGPEAFASVGLKR